MLESILIGLIAVIGLCTYLTGTSMIDRPIVLGPLVGLVLGDLTQGIIVGASIELAFMGVMYVGGAVPVNALAGGIIATAVAIKTGTGVEAALALAIPAGALFSLIEKIYYISIQYILRKFDKACENAEVNKIPKLHFLCFAIWSTFWFVLTFVTVQFGSAVVGDFFNSLPEAINNGISAGTAILPALGFALLINAIWNKQTAAFYFIGFALASYLGMDTIGISVLAACIGVLFFTLDPMGLPSFSNESGHTPMLTRKDLNRIFWRSLTLEASFTYERYHGTGYTYSVLPALKKFYQDDKEGLAGAMVRGTEFISITPHISTLVMGVTCAMEEQYSQNKESMDPTSITAVRAGLMGPLAGIGDSIFWGILRTVAAGIACAMGLKGSVFAPIAFILVYNVPALLVRYFGLLKTYELGIQLVARMSESKLLERLSKCAGIIGLMVIGGMTASMVAVQTPLAFNIGGSEIVIQEFLDSIMPGMLSLVVVFVMSKLVKKQVSTIVLMVGLLAAGILLAMVGVL